MSPLVVLLALNALTEFVTLLSVVPLFEVVVRRVVLIISPAPDDTPGMTAAVDSVIVPLLAVSVTLKGPLPQQLVSMEPFITRFPLALVIVTFPTPLRPLWPKSSNVVGSLVTPESAIVTSPLP